MNMKIIFNSLMGVCAVVLAILCVLSVLTPIRFEDKRSERERLVIQSLVEIRRAQIEFHRLHQRYTGSLDTLVQFVEHGTIPIIRMEGILTEEHLEYGLTEAEAVLRGYIVRDTTFVNVKETLFGKDFDVNRLVYIPFGNGAKFDMAAGTVATARGTQIVQVFQARAHFNTFLSDLDNQLRVNLIDRAHTLYRFPGLQVGSIEFANNNAGNWE